MKVISATIKQYLPHIVGFCVIVILVFFFMQTQRASKYYNKYLVSEGKFQAKNTAYIKLKEKTDVEKAILARERNEEVKVRKERDKEIKKIRTEGKKKDVALVQAKAKIKELTPDELTIKLNYRVPSQYALLGTEDFSLTRRGGELTLGLFMDGERCVETIIEKDKEIEKHKDKEKSFNTDRASFKIDLTKTEKLVSDCDEARLAAITSKENLEKAFKSMRWKERAKGAVGGGLLVVVILKVAGAI